MTPLILMSVTGPLLSRNHFHNGFDDSKLASDWLKCRSLRAGETGNTARGKVTYWVTFPLESIACKQAPTNRERAVGIGGDSLTVDFIATAQGEASMAISPSAKPSAEALSVIVPWPSVART